MSRFSIFRVVFTFKMKNLKWKCQIKANFRFLTTFFWVSFSCKFGKAPVPWVFGQNLPWVFAVLSFFRLESLRFCSKKSLNYTYYSIDFNMPGIKWESPWSNKLTGIIEIFPPYFTFHIHPPPMCYAQQLLCEQWKKREEHMLLL